MFDWVENIPLAKSLNFNIKFPIVPSLQIKPRKYSAGKYVRHHFWKDEGAWWESKQNECWHRSNRPKGSLKRCYEKFRRIRKKTSVPESLFWQSKSL